MPKSKKKAADDFEEFQQNADQFELVEMVEAEEIEVEDEDIQPTLAEPIVPLDPVASKAWRFGKTEAEITDLLHRGEFGGLKLVPWGSNYTFIAPICDPTDQQEYAVIYKPMRGEAPLWDFPSGTLYKREYGAYLVGRALGWHFIPPVIIRDGPHGLGTVQLFVDVDERIQFYDFREYHEHELKRMVVFDYITNNADRKAGHCLRGADGFIWAIDHGLCFNHVPKLRTVMWDWAGQPIPDDICQDLAEFATDATRLKVLHDQLNELLDKRELQLVFERLEAIINEPTFPNLNSRRQIPWGFF